MNGQIVDLNGTCVQENRTLYDRYYRSYKALYKRVHQSDHFGI